MKKISPEKEQQLLTAIEKTAALVADGLHPTDAVVKAASETGLRPGDVSLVVHAYNTGRTTRQRLDGSDPLEKAAEFDLANTADVLEKLYPSQTKTAAAEQREAALSSDYSYSPEPMLARKRVWEKRATEHDWRKLPDGTEITQPPPLPVDPQSQARKAMATVERAKRAAEEARRQESASLDRLGLEFCKLAEYFRRPDAVPLTVAREVAVTLHGEQGGLVLDQVVQYAPALTKLANHRLGESLLGVSGRQSYITADRVDATCQPFPQIAEVIRCADGYKTAKTAAAEAATCGSQEAGRALAPFIDPARHSILGPSSDGRASEELEKAASLDITDPLRMLGGISLVKKTFEPIADKIKGPDQSVKVDKIVQDLADPEHEMRLREISARASLQDLMLNDPVISGYDPEEVTAAYNDIIQLAPAIADQRMLVQGLLRKQLQQGQLDTFEQDQLLGFGDKLHQRMHPQRASSRSGSISSII